MLALGIFSRLGYLRAWDELSAGLGGLGGQRQSEKALRRCGPVEPESA